MSGQPRKVVPARVGFLAIYNPSLGTTDETIEDQIVYYSSTESRGERSRLKGASDAKAIQDAIREVNNEQLRQIGLAQGMVEFGRSFSEGRSVDTIETEKSRIILHELEAGWWILASINLTILPGTPKSKEKDASERNTIEYSSREVKPPILLLGDLLQAHSTFLLHHASSLSALFVRTRRSKFIAILGRYWDTFLSTWNVLMHGNPANKLYGGIKIAACGELGIGVGEEERGSGERDVLEGFVSRVDGLVDVIVSKFGNEKSSEVHEKGKKSSSPAKQTVPWLGSGDEPAAEDGAIFLGTGALSRKSLRDVSHWIEDLYRWGPHAYGVIDNPSSNRPRKKSRTKLEPAKKELSPEAKHGSRKSYGLPINDKGNGQGPETTAPPKPEEFSDERHKHEIKDAHPGVERELSSKSFASTDSESATNKFVSYLKLGYGTHWSLGAGNNHEKQNNVKVAETKAKTYPEPPGTETGKSSPLRALMFPTDDTAGHFLIGLMGSLEDEEEEEIEEVEAENFMRYSAETEGYNARLVLRTLTLELEREEDARAEGEISIDLGSTDNDGHSSSKHTSSEHTATSNTSFESQDRNKTKKLRVVVYVRKPFIFVILFELRTDALTLTSLYRSMHYQLGSLHKPLLKSTSYRASKPEIATTDPEHAKTPIYDLVYDRRLLTVNSTIPNIPNPFQMQSNSNEFLPWSRIEALNTHMQIIQTYISTTLDSSELERTCKTSRGWWVVWTRVPDSEQPTFLASGKVKIPALVQEDSLDSAQSVRLTPGRFHSHTTSLVDPSMKSGCAHPFLETPSNPNSFPNDKEVFLIRRASDYIATKSSGRIMSGSSVGADAGWAAEPGKLVQGIGVDTKRYIEGLLNLNR